jgi:hypothetical protein
MSKTPHAFSRCALTVAIALASAMTLAQSQTDLRHFTQAQARTLLAIARDLFASSEPREADLERCLRQVDAATSDEQRPAIADAMSLLDGALRRMGYQAYEDISDEDERVRMAKMLAEGRWMRGYRASMGQCLAQVQ